MTNAKTKMKNPTISHPHPLKKLLNTLYTCDNLYIKLFSGKTRNYFTNFTAYFLKMDFLSDRIKRLAESETILMARKSREMKAKGIDIIDLSLGEPDFDTPDHIKEAGKKAIDDGYTKYTPVAGLPQLRQAVAAKFKNDNGLDYKPEQIVVSTGAKQSLTNILMSVVNPGDEVIMPSPYWVSYREMIKLAQGIQVEIITDIVNDFKITAQELESAITDKTKILILNSPCNPTGSVYSKEELDSLASVLLKHPGILVISDEIYEYTNFMDAHHSISQIKEIHDRVAIVHGVSKGFSMTGWRIGFMAAPEWLAKACDKMQGQITSGANAMAQMAALKALTSDLTPTWEMKKAFKQRRDTTINKLREIPGIKINEPEGAFYVFPDVSEHFGKSSGETIINNVDDLCIFLLNNAHVSIVTGNAFGSPNNVRISYATSEEKLIEACERIKAALATLK